MVPRGVIRNEVDEDANAVCPRIRDELLGLGGGSELFVDLPVVGHVVPTVEERRAVPRIDPEGVDPETFEVRQASAHAGDVARAVAVAVGERPDVDLVDDRVAPPLVTDGRRRAGIWVMLHDERTYRTVRHRGDRQSRADPLAARPAVNAYTPHAWT